MGGSLPASMVVSVSTVFTNTDGFSLAELYKQFYIPNLFAVQLPLAFTMTKWRFVWQLTYNPAINAGSSMRRDIP